MDFTEKSKFLSVRENNFFMCILMTKKGRNNSKNNIIKFIDYRVFNVIWQGNCTECKNIGIYYISIPTKKVWK